jgi:hypothetical protein
MGIDLSNPPTRVKKALSHYSKILDIQQFIKVAEIQINPVMFSWFWQVLVDGQSTHLGRLTLEWFGYEGEDYTMKRKFKDLLIRNNVPYQELTYNDPEASNYPTIAEEAALLPHNAARTRQRFIIMAPRDIKKAVMMLNTKAADTIRNYYLDLEDLVREYACYTACFREREKEHQLELKDDRIDELMQQLKTMSIKSEQRAIKQEEKIDEILEQNDTLIEQNTSLHEDVKDVKTKLGLACVERAPLPHKASKQERFLLLKRNDDDYPYYVIRAQNSNAQAAKKRQESVYNIEVLLDLQCQPNSKTLFVRIRDDLKKRDVIFSGNSLSIENSDIDEEELIKVMNEINSNKFVV